jgi:hypothetical protein
VVVGGIVAVVGGVIIGLALGADDPSPEASSTTTTMQEGDPFEEAVANGVIVASENLVNRRQATCVARRLIRTLGRAELLGLGRAAARGGDLEPAVEAAVLEAMVGCVPADVLEEIGDRREGAP